MHTDRDFLATIDTRPDDRAFRLIYADWLDEQSDPRGELIRVEEEMRQLPVYSDPFWALKPRRNELRSQADAHWLACMRYGTECEPVFRHGIPDGWRERWRLIREFTERWYRKPMPDVGSRSELRKFSQAVDPMLSPSVCEWIAYAWDLTPSGRPTVVHRDQYTMESLPGVPAHSLLMEAEGEYHWAVQFGDLHLPDPPVRRYDLDYERENEATFIPSEDDPVTWSVTEFVLNYAMDCLGGDGDVGGFEKEVSSPPDPLIQNLTASFPVRARCGGTDIFEADNFLVRLHRGPNRVTLQVELFKPMPPEAVPAFLWDYTIGVGSAYGMFAQSAFRDRFLARKFREASHEPRAD
jgi:uncharacterized protein (TIGR02996 family)